VNEKKLHDLIHRDVLDETQKLTGGSYAAAGTLTHALAMENFLEHRRDLNAALQSAGDTRSQMSTMDYLAVVRQVGFEIVSHYPFKGCGYGDVPNVDEDFFVLWRAGILLVFDTFGGESVNSASFYYNWKPHAKDDWTYGLGSGHCDENGIVIGHQDAREGLKTHLSLMEKLGTFLPNWGERPFMWLLHHGDTKVLNFDSDKINEERIALLPEAVKKAISP
jgi:hypothetical protein